MRLKSPPPRTVRQTTTRLDRILVDAEILKVPKNGWIRAIREAISMSQTQLARRMGVSQQAVHNLERAEVDKSITLARLQRAADALGCELTYTLVPRKPLQTLVTDQSLKRAKQKMKRVNRSQALEASAGASTSMINDLAREMAMNRPADLWDE